MELLELDAGLPVGELPVDGGLPRVALVLQRPHPLLQGRRVRHRAGEVAPLEDADLDLGLVQLAAMLGGVVELELGEDVAGLLRRDSLVKCTGGVGVEVVLHDADVVGIWVALLDQIAQHLGIEPVKDLTLNTIERRRIGAEMSPRLFVASLGCGVSGLSWRFVALPVSYSRLPRPCAVEFITGSR